MELFFFAAFVAGLVAGMALGIPLWSSLLFGLFLFLGYGILRRFPLKNLLVAAGKSAWTAKNISIVMLFVGALTALWRASGTIAYIVNGSVDFMPVQIFLPAVFLLNAMMSVLTGTSMGTVATMGIVCISMGDALGVDSLMTGGAIMSGAFFGDRWSPVSTSALLVADVTETKLYTNLGNMAKSCIVPTLVTLGIYFVLSYGAVTEGIALAQNGSVGGLKEGFAASFNLHPVTLLPAAAIVILSIARVGVKITMVVSLLISAILCYFLQTMDLKTIFEVAVFGFHPTEGAVARMLAGGGLLGMLKLIIAVCIALSFGGIFRLTGMLSRIRSLLARFAQRTSSFAGLLFTAIITNMFACNQSLSIFLTKELCSDFVQDKNRLALFIEDTCITIAALVPWSVACLIPVEMLQKGTGILPYAFFLYLLPLWGLVFDVFKQAFLKPKK